VASGDVSCALGCTRGFAPHPNTGACSAKENGHEREVVGEPEWKSERQQKTVTRMQQHRLRHAFDGQPAVARQHGVALESLVFRIRDGAVAQ